MTPINNITPEMQIEILNRKIAESADDASLYVERGKLLWRLNRRGEAISDYERAAALDPAGPGGLLLEHSNNIMDFFNPDLLNP